MQTSGFLVKPEIPVRETLRLWQVFIPKMDQPFSMYGMFTYIWVFFGARVGKYAIHGAYGYYTWNPWTVKIQQFPASIEGAHQLQGWFINPANYRYIMIYPPQAQQFFELWLRTLISISYKTL